MTRKWMVPAAAALSFGVFSTWVAVKYGPLGFWPKHVSDPWGVQIFADLVLSITVALVFVGGEARRRNVARWPWVIATCASPGSRSRHGRSRRPATEAGARRCTAGLLGALNANLARPTSTLQCS